MNNTATRCAGDTCDEAKRDLRATILNQATQLFAEQGYAGTSIRELVERSECTKPALYYYFKSKEELFQQVVQREIDTVSELIRRSVSAPGNIRERLHASIASLIEYATNDPHGMCLLWRLEVTAEEGMPHVDMGGTREMHLGMLEAFIRQGMEHGEVRPEVDSRDCALVLSGVIDYQFQMAAGGQELCAKQLARTIDLVLDGIATP